jgi:hypothetical protein
MLRRVDSESTTMYRNVGNSLHVYNIYDGRIFEYIQLRQRHISCYNDLFPLLRLSKCFLNGSIQNFGIIHIVNFAHRLVLTK